MGLFGGGNSSSSQLVTTNNDASNLQAGELGFRGNNNTTTINKLDGGAVADSFKFASDATVGSFKFGSDALKSLTEVFGSSLAATQKSTSDAIAVTQSANDRISDAYKSASGGVDKTRSYIIAASLIAVVVGIYFLRAE